VGCIGAEFLTNLPVGLACVPGFEFFCLDGKICTDFACAGFTFVASFSLRSVTACVAYLRG